jgi:hypothetical protein
MAKDEINPEKMFELLVLNAIDYLETSIKQLDTRPKYSLINFVTAVELFLKAPLLKEHWTLLIENMDVKKMSRENFTQGRLLTIGFDQTIIRLDKVLGFKLSTKAKDCFDNLRNHRNKLIHFYNKDYSRKSKELISQVLIEQCEAWYYLYELLHGKWNDIFSDYRHKIISLHSKIKHNKKYFAGKYNALKEKFRSIETSGGILLRCIICDCKSVLLSDYTGMWHIGECSVCDHTQNYLVINCPNNQCNRSIILDEGYSKCDHCNREINPEVLLSLFGEPSEDIYCTECFNAMPSVITVEGEYLCLSCLESFDDTSECQWCLTKYAGDVGEDTNLKGCENCDGWIGSQMSKDD